MEIYKNNGYYILYNKDISFSVFWWAEWVHWLPWSGWFWYVWLDYRHPGSPEEEIPKELIPQLIKTIEDKREEWNKNLRLSEQMLLHLNNNLEWNTK